MKRCSRFATIFALVAASFPVFSQVPTLDDVLRRARERVTRDEEQWALLLADEQCEEKAFEGGEERSNQPFAFGGVGTRIDSRGRRRWQAELATVRTPALASRGTPWLEFRNIVTVDGRPVQNRSPQMSRLFVEQPEWSLDAARQLDDGSARFYIGEVPRAVKTPGLPLLLLHPANSTRFSFTRAGEEGVDNLKTWKIEVREQLEPTVLTSGGPSCPVSGTLWVDPTTGELVRAMLQCVPGQDLEAVDRITVKYRGDPKLRIRVPVEMIERPEAPSAKQSWFGNGRVWVEGKCTYSNFRRFDTAARMIPPK